MQADWPPEESLSSRKEHCAEPISIIIPALNEESVLPATLESTRSSRPHEVILVDGGSVDGTQKVATRYGAKILLSAAGRAREMNRGAAAASGSVFLFLHADTRLPRHFDRRVCEALSCSTVVAGAFELGIDASTPSLRWIERMANWRSRRLHMPYGDQAIFVRAAVFRAIGGFSELPIMEDFELMLRLRKLGRIAIIPQPVLTSACIAGVLISDPNFRAPVTSDEVVMAAKQF
jgi:rSAM/selenodomain-associated transferase 2